MASIRSEQKRAGPRFERLVIVRGSSQLEDDPNFRFDESRRLLLSQG